MPSAEDLALALGVSLEEARLCIAEAEEASANVPKAAPSTSSAGKTPKAKAKSQTKAAQKAPAVPSEDLEFAPLPESSEAPGVQEPDAAAASAEPAALSRALAAEMETFVEETAVAHDPAEEETQQEQAITESRAAAPAAVASKLKSPNLPKQVVVDDESADEKEPVDGREKPREPVKTEAGEPSYSSFFALMPFAYTHACIKKYIHECLGMAGFSDEASSSKRDAAVGNLYTGLQAATIYRSFKIVFTSGPWTPCCVPGACCDCKWKREAESSMFLHAGRTNALLIFPAA